MNISNLEQQIDELKAAVAHKTFAYEKLKQQSEQKMQTLTSRIEEDMMLFVLLFAECDSLRSRVAIN